MIQRPALQARDDLAQKNETQIAVDDRPWPGTKSQLAYQFDGLLLLLLGYAPGHRRLGACTELHEQIAPVMQAAGMRQQVVNFNVFRINGQDGLIHRQPGQGVRALRGVGPTRAAAGKFGNDVAQTRVQTQAPGADELQDGRGGEQLGDRGQIEACIVRQRSPFVVAPVRVEDGLAVLNDAHGNGRKYSVQRVLQQALKRALAGLRKRRSVQFEHGQIRCRGRRAGGRAQIDADPSRAGYDGVIADRPDQPMLYFAYGSNMDMSQMAFRCPGATLVGVGCLCNHHFGINPRGYATVIPQVGQRVFGLVWNIGQEDVCSLDRYESVPVHYQRAALAIARPGQPIENMLVYVAVESQRGVAREGYMEKIVAAARCADLPADYQQMLATWLTRSPPVASAQGQ